MNFLRDEYERELERASDDFRCIFEEGISKIIELELGEERFQYYVTEFKEEWGHDLLNAFKELAVYDDQDKFDSFVAEWCKAIEEYTDEAKNSCCSNGCMKCTASWSDFY